MATADDATLQTQAFLARLASGDNSAFEAVFHTYYRRVYAVAYRLLRSPLAADDIAQEAFLQLYRKPLPAGREHNLLAWLLRVATNLCYNAQRSERRRRTREERLPEAETLPTGEADTADKVRQVLAQLPERQAQILLLRHSGLSYKDIAAAIEVSPGSIGTLLARAEAAFQELYRRLEEGENDA